MATQYHDDLDGIGVHPRGLRGAARARSLATGSGRRWATVIVSLTLLGGLAVALPAAADPAGDGSSTASDLPPTTSHEAKQAWLRAAEASEAANEELLAAKSAEQRAHLDLGDARLGVMQALLAASDAQADSVRASSEYESYRAQLAEFASASFRSADFGELAAVLTSDSTSEFLDKISSLDQVAGSTKLLMIQAMDAKTAAQVASQRAADAQVAAAAAQERADAAVAEAANATAEVKKRKKKLDDQVESYRLLFDALTASERVAAMESQQIEWERQAQLAEEARQVADTDVPADDNGSRATGRDTPADDESVDTTSDSTRSKAAKAVEAALSKLGRPYVYGSSGPNTFDCSGLTSWAWAQAGVSIPRTSSGQAGLKNVALDDLQPGDLVTYYSPVHHVAMYIGNGQIIHASTEGKPVFITSVYRGGPYPTGHRVNY